MRGRHYDQREPLRTGPKRKVKKTVPEQQNGTRTSMSVIVPFAKISIIKSSISIEIIVRGRGIHGPLYKRDRMILKNSVLLQCLWTGGTDGSRLPEGLVRR